MNRREKMIALNPTKQGSKLLHMKKAMTVAVQGPHENLLRMICKGREGKGRLDMSCNIMCPLERKRFRLDEAILPNVSKVIQRASGNF